MLSWLVALMAISAAVGLALTGAFDANQRYNDLHMSKEARIWSHSHQCIEPQPSQLIGAALSLPPPGSRVLVTGAAGFIGSHVAEYLADVLRLAVVATDDLSGGFLENVPAHTTFVLGDLKNDTFIEELFDTHGPFYAVYHLAAYAAEGMSHFIRKFNYRNNLVSSAALLNEAVIHGTKVFVFTSSIAAYGVGSPPMLEDDHCEPEDPYGVAKLAFEQDLRAATHMFNISHIIFRPHNVYGPRQNIIDKYRNVIGIFISAIRRNQSLPIFGDGLQTRAFSYIDDVAPMIAAAPFIEGALNQTFNVGSDQPYSLLELAHTIATAMDVVPNLLHLPPRLEVTHASSLHDKIKCIFGLGKPISLADGIRKVVDWVRSKANFVPVEFDRVEVLQGMPESWITPRMRDNQRKSKHAARTSPSTTDRHT